MRLQTILNRVEQLKSFVHGEASWEDHDDAPALVVQVRPRKNTKPSCSACGRRGRAYDRLKERRFEFVRGPVSARAVEGLNNKVKLVTRKSYGFRTPEVA